MTKAYANDDNGLPQIAILFSQFAAYHVDRVEATARRLAGRARVLAVECATTSQTYAWEPAAGIEQAEHVTLFPGRSYDDIGSFARLRAYSGAVRAAHSVLVGVPYSEPDIIALSWRLRARGKRAIVMTESKFDDVPRSIMREQIKARVLGAYQGAIVGGLRQRDYLRFLGFEDRPVLPGYDTVGMERLRSSVEPEQLPWAERDFLFVGRFVEKKNLPVLIEAYARYSALAGGNARRLVLAGDGPQGEALRSQVAELRIADRVEFTGFLDATAVAGRLACALALMLPSTEEQWGLVVNEATAFGVPSIVSTNVGSRDALVRNGVAGFVVEPQSVESLARAMLSLSASEAEWERHSRATGERAWLADTERFADAVELVFDPGAAQARENVERFWNELEHR